MESTINFLLQWVQNNQTIVWIVSSLSLAVFLAFLIGVPVIIVKLPADYFQRSRSALFKGKPKSFSRIIYLILKNITGAVLLLTGIAMLFLPGQGLFTMIVGLSLLDIPYKRRIVRRIIREQHVLGSLNRLRARFNRPHFNF